MTRCDLVGCFCEATRYKNDFRGSMPLFCNVYEYQFRGLNIHPKNNIYCVVHILGDREIA